MSLPKGVKMVSAIYQPDKNNQINVPIINLTDTEQIMMLPEPELKPIDQILKIKLEKTKEDRSKLLRQNLRLNHLNDIEKEKLKNLLQEYKDIFLLPGDQIKTTIEQFHEIKTSDEKPVYAKNYRFPEAHKGEVESQIKELLNQGII